MENPESKDKWTNDYSFVENNRKSLCLNAMKTIGVVKVNSIKHFNSK